MSLATRWWNFRFRLAWRIAPGRIKHLSCDFEEEA